MKIFVVTAVQGIDPSEVTYAKSFTSMEKAQDHIDYITCESNKFHQGVMTATAKSAQSIKEWYASLPKYTYHKDTWDAHSELHKWAERWSDPYWGDWSLNTEMNKQGILNFFRKPAKTLGINSLPKIENPPVWFHNFPIVSHYELSIHEMELE